MGRCRSRQRPGAPRARADRRRWRPSAAGTQDQERQLRRSRRRDGRATAGVSATLLDPAAPRGVPVERCPLFAKATDVTRSWSPNWVTKRFAVALDQAGVEHFRLHDLRHFVATQMLASGVALPVVSARLGHARVSTTLNVYAASMPAWDRAAAETLSAAPTRQLNIRAAGSSPWVRRIVGTGQPDRLHTVARQTADQSRPVPPDG